MTEGEKEDVEALPVEAPLLLEEGRGTAGPLIIEASEPTFTELGSMVVTGTYTTYPGYMVMFVADEAR